MIRSLFSGHASAGMEIKYDVAFSAFLFRRRIRNNIRQPQWGDGRRSSLSSPNVVPLHKSVYHYESYYTRLVL